MKIYKNLFGKIISSENLFSAWDAFKSDKRNKRDVMEFERNLEENIFQLQRELRAQTYRHGDYFGFYIHDPKLRHIHKAEVRDRILHHAIFNVINPVFEPTFIPTSFSCRIGFGTHKGVETLARAVRKVSQNGSAKCFILKCDVRKFFDTVDHGILTTILSKRIKDPKTIWLLKETIESFSSEKSTIFERKGVPIGNLTSQTFANIYLNEFDQFVKQSLKVRHYARYTDDFVIVSGDESYLKGLIPKLEEFLEKRLALKLHPGKVYIRKLRQGMDFLGYVVFLHHRLLREKTKRRIFMKLKARVRAYEMGEITKFTLDQSLMSYLGAMSHANTYKLRGNLLNQFWFYKTKLD